MPPQNLTWRFQFRPSQPCATMIVGAGCDCFTVTSGIVTSFDPVLSASRCVTLAPSKRVHAASRNDGEIATTQNQ